MSFSRDALLLAGAIHGASFAAFHLLFWRLFDWRTELPRLNVANRGIVPVLNLCLTFFFVGFALILVIDGREILSTRLGNHVLLMLSGFWGVRLLAQFVWFPMRHWASWVLSVLFLAGAVIYGVAAIGS